MVLNKLQEALAEIGMQRKALDRVENQLKSMISELSGIPDIASPVSRSYPTPSAAMPVVFREGNRDKLDDIADVLRAAGGPLHITAIAEGLSKLTSKKVDRTSIEPGLNRHVATVKARRIEKFGPSTFGLPEWKSQQPTLAHIA